MDPQSKTWRDFFLTTNGDTDDGKDDSYVCTMQSILMNKKTGLRSVATIFGHEEFGDDGGEKWGPSGTIVDNDTDWVCPTWTADTAGLFGAQGTKETALKEAEITAVRNLKVGDVVRFGSSRSTSYDEYAEILEIADMERLFNGTASKIPISLYYRGDYGVAAWANIGHGVSDVEVAPHRIYKVVVDCASGNFQTRVSVGWIVKQTHIGATAPQANIDAAGVVFKKSFDTSTNDLTLWVSATAHVSALMNLHGRSCAFTSDVDMVFPNATTPSTAHNAGTDDGGTVQNAHISSCALHNSTEFNITQSSGSVPLRKLDGYGGDGQCNSFVMQLPVSRKEVSGGPHEYNYEHTNAAWCMDWTPGTYTITQYTVPTAAGNKLNRVDGKMHDYDLFSYDGTKQLAMGKGAGVGLTLVVEVNKRKRDSASDEIVPQTLIVGDDAAMANGVNSASVNIGEVPTTTTGAPTLAAFDTTLGTRGGVVTSKHVKVCSSGFGFQAFTETPTAYTVGGCVRIHGAALGGGSIRLVDMQQGPRVNEQPDTDYYWNSPTSAAGGWAVGDAITITPPNAESGNWTPRTATAVVGSVSVAGEVRYLSIRNDTTLANLQARHGALEAGSVLLASNDPGGSSSGEGLSIMVLPTTAITGQPDYPDHLSIGVAYQGPSGAGPMHGFRIHSGGKDYAVDEEVKISTSAGDLYFKIFKVYTQTGHVTSIAITDGGAGYISENVHDANNPTNPKAHEIYATFNAVKGNNATSVKVPCYLHENNDLYLNITGNGEAVGTTYLKSASQGAPLSTHGDTVEESPEDSGVYDLGNPETFHDLKNGDDVEVMRLTRPNTGTVYTGASNVFKGSGALHGVAEWTVVGWTESDPPKIGDRFKWNGAGVGDSATDFRAAQSPAWTAQVGAFLYVRRIPTHPDFHFSFKQERGKAVLYDDSTVGTSSARPATLVPGWTYEVVTKKKSHPLTGNIPPLVGPQGTTFVASATSLTPYHATTGGVATYGMGITGGYNYAGTVATLGCAHKAFRINGIRNLTALPTNRPYENKLHVPVELDGRYQGYGPSSGLWEKQKQDPIKTQGQMLMMQDHRRNLADLRYRNWAHFGDVTGQDSYYPMFVRNVGENNTLELKLDNDLKMSKITLVAYKLDAVKAPGHNHGHESLSDDYYILRMENIRGAVFSNNQHANGALAIIGAPGAINYADGGLHYSRFSDHNSGGIAQFNLGATAGTNSIIIKLLDRAGQPVKSGRLHLWFKVLA